MLKTILLVDNDLHDLQSLERLLSDGGYNVLTATCVLDGLELLRKRSLQLVICNEQMPLMNGTEFLKKVKALYPETSRMILSSNVDFDLIKEAINVAGICKFIIKPWLEHVLLQYVHEAFAAGVKKNKNSCLHLAQMLRDPLTNLPNRLSFYESLWKFILKSKTKHMRFAVAYFDIDRFNNMNGFLGLKKCDYILQLLSERLKNFIKDEKKVARMGNDEFVVIITEENKVLDLQVVLKKLFSIIKTPINIGKSKHHLSVSMGVCVYPDHGENAEQLMKHVAVALQHSQRLGGDNYQLYEQFVDNLEDELIFLQDELYEALEKKQFVIHYQPIYTMDKSKLVSVEALLRWQHPKLGLLNPNKFLTFCEETNLIVPIGAWVLRAACQQIKLWQDLGFPELVLAVNFSARQFNHPRLVDLIIDTLETTSLVPHCLELEITETLIMQNPDKIILLLNILRKIGVQLALDDFGTGYSSLSYLRQFPFTHLKIDRSFITDMVTIGNGKAIVKAIISLGKILGLKIIAEGVETKEQLALLKGKNCDYVQGYYYSKPLPAHQIEQLLVGLKNNCQQ